MTATETFEHADLTVAIHYDDSGCGDPRDADNLGHLFCWHPNYTLGDEQFTRADFDTIEEVFREVKQVRKATVVLPLFIYDHSGVTMFAGEAIDALSEADVSTRNRAPFDGAGWDTSWVGFAYATEERRKLLGVSRSREEIERQLRIEIEEYDKFLRGEVFGYVITDEYERHLDSCWGFLGHTYVLAQAREAADWTAADVIGKDLNRLPIAGR